MTQTIPSFTTRLEEGKISELRVYYNQCPEELSFLFEEYVNQQEWVAEYPVLSLKAFSLLNPDLQQSGENLTLLRTIFAAGLLIKDQEGLIDKVIRDAVKNNNWSFIFKLIEYGVSKDLILKNNQTLLHKACDFLNSDAALKLLDLQVEVDVPDEERNTPLHLAVGNGLIEVASRLLQRGADPLAINEEGRTPLHYACILANNELLELFRTRFQHYVWQSLFASTLLDCEKEEAAVEVIQGVIDAKHFESFLPQALLYSNLISFLKSQFREVLNRHLEIIRNCSETLRLEQKLEVLHLLHPSDIAETMQRVGAADVSRRLREVIVVEEVPGEYDVTNTIDGALREVNSVWLPNIVWNSQEQDSHSGYLMGRLSAMFARIELATLSLAARDPSLGPIVEKCLPILDFDQSAVVIPQLSLEAFLTFIQILPIQRQFVILKSAKDCQKIHYLRELSIPCDPSIDKWHSESNQYFWRGIETVADLRYVKRIVPKEFYDALCAKFDEIVLSLPLALKRDGMLLQALKNALLSNDPSHELKMLVRQRLDAMIVRNGRVSGQIEKIRDCLRQDPLYHKKKAVELREPDGEILCGINKVPMEDPVTAHGHSFERGAITTWLENSRACPICRKEVTIDDFKEDSDLKAKIELWHKSGGGK